MKVKAFTLVELLIVVAILAILMAMLLPSLSKAKEQAKNVRCLSNLKAQGILFAYYAHDYADFYPCGTDQYSWGWDDNWCYDEKLQYLYLPPVVTYAWQETPTINKHIAGSPIWDCPNADDWDHGVGGPVSSDRTGRGYGYNGAFYYYWYSGDPVWTGWGTATKMPEKRVIVTGDRPQSCIFGVMEGMDLAQPSTAELTDPAAIDLRRHKNHVNYLFTDGSAASMTLAGAYPINNWEWRAAFGAP